ncbi:MAG: SDR family oxidoreductase [Micrococcales bacterium]|nr:SDR family oxidoreductase [Micrococcales bacterium]
MPHEAAPAVQSPTPHVLVTGATGFVGQAIVERLLSSTNARISVLIRPRGERTGAERLSELVKKPVFGPWRHSLGERAASAEIASRVRVLEGDLRDVPALPSDLDAVVHSASSVSFDDPIDSALTTNVGGPLALYRALERAGNDPHVVHISTCYVSTGRVDVAPEARLEHAADWRAELSGALETRRRLARIHGPQGADLTKALRQAGRERAHELGWTDSYTMTKALGERVAEEMWAQAGRRLTILRPSIIESALHHPYPGWIDGFKVADPLIAAYAQGRLIGFPGQPENVLDVIPVDFVVSAAIASLRTPPEPGGVDYLQVSSSRSNPLTLGDLRQWVQTYFAAHPWIDKDGNEVRPDQWQFSDPEALSRWVRRRRRVLSRSAALLELLPDGMLTSARTAVRRGLRGLDVMGGFVDLYQPYTCASTTFENTRTRALLAEHAQPSDRLDIMTIDWQRYLTQAHLPAIATIMSRRAQPKRRADVSGLPTPGRHPGAYGARAARARHAGGPDPAEGARTPVGALGA